MIVELCRRCHGTGWCRVVDDECPCVAHAEHCDVEPDPQVLGFAAQARIECELRRVLIRARRADAESLAASLARAAARGARPTEAQATQLFGAELGPRLVDAIARAA